MSEPLSLKAGGLYRGGAGMGGPISTIGLLVGDVSGPELSEKISSTITEDCAAECGSSSPTGCTK